LPISFRLSRFCPRPFSVHPLNFSADEELCPK
jgi:hypothetical protein